MILIGLTGGFGSGKSTVAEMFVRQGAVVLDADKISHEMIEPGGKAVRQVIQEFGQEIVTEKRIDRQKLAKIVFKDRKKLSKLMGIIHPIVLKEVQLRIKNLSKTNNTSLVIIDAPLLIEAGWHQWVDYLIVVKSNLAQQIVRIKSRSGLTMAQVLARIKSQLPMSQKINMADMVIDNRKDLKFTRTQVEKIVEVLRNRAQCL